MKTDLAKFTYKPDEQIAIKAAMKLAKPWESSGIKKIKRRIKNFHLERSKKTCCYCQRDLQGEFQMVIDVEHILPSSIFVDLTFEIWNLSASCKRCNMLIKNDNIDFIDGSISNFFSPQYYKFVHPNFDDVQIHLVRLVMQMGQDRLVKYVVRNSLKGEFAYEYFRLSDFEIGAFDEAQDANLTDPAHRGAFEWMRAQVERLQSSAGA